MTQAVKKTREWVFAKKAAELLGKVWDIADYEAPDFIITEGTQRFGLEICQIFTGQRDEKGSRSKKNEAENQERIDMYRRKYEGKANALLNVQLVGDTCDENMEEVVQLLFEKELSEKPAGYSEQFQVPFDIKDLIAEIMESGRHESLTTKEIMESEYRERFESLLCSETRGRLIVNVTRLPDSFPRRSDDWYSVDDRVGWVGDASEDINSAIREKAKKLSEYKQNSGLDDIRLLIVADHLRASGMQELRERREFDPQGFQMVYFLNYPESAHAIGRIRKVA